LWTGGGALEPRRRLRESSRREWRGRGGPGAGRACPAPMSSPKDVAKRACASAVEALGAGRGGDRSVILCYHSVHPDRPYRSVTPERFREHLAWLEEHAQVVRLDDIRRVGTSDRPRVAITFDDGYVDNATHAFPLLEERRLSATFFVTAGLLDRDDG